MAIKSVSDTGPYIHLTEIDQLQILRLFLPLGIGPEVENELRGRKLKKPKFATSIAPNPKAKELINILVLQYELDLGEAESIALVRQENARLFFTDDLDARESAKALGIEVHGTIGILLRGFREQKIGKKETIEKLRALLDSSLFVTPALVDFAINEVQRYK